MMQSVTVRLASPAHEMAQEEILKKLAHVSRQIANARFVSAGSELQFDVPADQASLQAARVQKLAHAVQRSLRGLRRQVRFQSRAMRQPVFRSVEQIKGVHSLGVGQVALEGLPLRLFRYFDRVFESFGQVWQPRPVLTPALIPADVLAKCGYFRSFPHTVTFATHLHEDMELIEQFRHRHQHRESLDERALSDMDTPQTCLTPATCYHIYHLNQHRMLPAAGVVYSVCGKCFRYESSNMRDWRRLWDFTMREVVFLGTAESVERWREQGIQMMADLLDAHELAGEIRTASDPFFVAPDTLTLAYFQLGSATKYEVSLLLPAGERLAVGSLNDHRDFFGRAFSISLESGHVAHSGCIAFGLERWVYAFLAQHGENLHRWPRAVRQAPEFSEQEG